jgi:hypothetical protein
MSQTSKTSRERAAFCRALAHVAQDERALNDLKHAAEMYENTAAQLEVLAV